ncbi:MAG: group III truncated hemoglobin, partial [Pseudomonadales bacterium]|nr:group III truncated hemoglobin [Pseudomonadales bacterium]
MSNKPDLDNETAISQMVDLFYDQLLDDQTMAPLFLEVAKVDLRAHLPTISLYWQKMLLGDKRYHNNTMAKHRIINRRHPFTIEHYDLWLFYFINTSQTHFSGPYTD